MTDTILEAPVEAPVDEALAGKKARSKAKVKSKSAAEHSGSSKAVPGKAAASLRASAAPVGKTLKASRSRATASDIPGGKAKRNGSALGAQEHEAIVPNGWVSAVELHAVELSAIQSTDGEEESEPTSAADGSPEETPKRRAFSWATIRRNVLSSSLAVTLAVAVVLLVLSQLSMNSKDSIDSAGTSALAAAKSYAVDLASYNYQHFDQNFGKVMAESTPTFRQSFALSSKSLKTVLIHYDAWARADVVAAGLVSANTSRAVVLVFLNQTDFNTIQKNKPTTPSRVEITLLSSHGRWLIDQVTLL